MTRSKARERSDDEILADLARAVEALRFMASWHNGHVTSTHYSPAENEEERIKRDEKLAAADWFDEVRRDLAEIYAEEAKA